MSSTGSKFKASALVVGGMMVVAIALAIGFVLGTSRRAPSTIEVSQAPREAEALSHRSTPGAVAEPAHAAAGRSLPSIPVDPAEPDAGQPKPLTADAERDQQVAELVRSGLDTTNQLRRLKDVNEEWTALAKELGQSVKIEPWRCYRAGCYATIADIEPARVEALGTRLMESRGFLAWPGGKFRSGPIPAKDGHVQVTWAFFAEEPEGTAPPPPPSVN